MARAHVFELLGSGPVEVRHGIECPGLEGHRYPAAPAVVHDPSGKWLRGRVTAANEAESRRIWGLVDPGYVPIDWQLDFKSGYRWSEMTWYRDVTFGDVPGADVKVPWELARMQHLPQLALADGDRGVHAREFRNQVLDFVATNPPRFGVNWAMTMDVAIRIVNWLVAYDLFRGQGVSFDPTFEAVFSRSVLEHGHHIVENLEWGRRLRANHYLADVVGLLFASAWLPRSPDADAWLAFSVGETIAEIEAQFLPDGGSFEASTSYHRLSGEMAVYAVALILGLSDDDRAAMATADPGRLPRAIRSRARPVPAEVMTGSVPASVVDRLERMAEFSMDLTRPSGMVAQIGDNDSGRFLRLLPAAWPDDGAANREHLDHRHLVGAIGGLLPRQDFLDFAGPWAAEADFVRALSRGRTLEPQRTGTTAARLQPPISVAPGTGDSLGAAAPTFVIEVGPGARRGLRTFAYPAFGVFGYRSDRVFLLVRCGSVGQNGLGGHAHNDQLGVELCVDDVDWIRDPGTYLYTPLPELRNRYRSSGAHFAPRLAGREPARLDLGLFELERGTVARCLAFGPDGFVGEIHYARGGSVLGGVSLEDDRVVVTWQFRGCQPDPRLAAADWHAWIPEVPFSPGYGILERPAP